MPDTPETRMSLLARLLDPQDEQAWHEFAVLYQPLIYRLGRRSGLQDADACELVQEVFVRVSNAIESWKTTGHPGAFRAWLFRISRNLLINMLTRKKRRRESVGSHDEQIDLFQKQPDPRSAESQLFDAEYRRQIFRRAADRVQPDFHPRTWSAFWETSVIGRPADEVAQELEMSRGAVYIARSRVVARLREEVRQIETTLDGRDSQANPQEASEWSTE